MTGQVLAARGDYKLIMACLACRKVFRARPRPGDQPPAAMTTTCPQCGQATVNMGRNFKAPRRRDIKQWRKVQALVESGVGFVSPRGPRPKRLRETPEYIERQRRQRQSPGARLLAAIDHKRGR